jgi:protein-S-isoprenylcysteine O-methyltransferase Ste14
VVVVEGPEGPPPGGFRAAVKRSIVSGMALISRLAGLVMVAVWAGVIRRGPYRLIRHPMYAAALVLIWATVLSHPSLLCLLVGAAVTVVVMPRILDEERRLRDRYPKYADYARSTKALVPFVL